MESNGEPEREATGVPRVCEWRTGVQVRLGEIRECRDCILCDRANGVSGMAQLGGEFERAAMFPLGNIWFYRHGECMNVPVR